ncbi:hypothetical protein BU17DRAFT_60038 [Hysterangium stoloniferum]|nr:hypothetical protein BU17DRAFT_60038 [Hysterangium stoloniferum]
MSKMVLKCVEATSSSLGIMSDPTELVALLRADFSVESSYMAAIVVMVYDYALTIHHEKSVWQRRWSLGKCLYLFVRYLGVFIAIFDFSANFRSESQVNWIITHLRERMDGLKKSYFVGSKKVFAVYGHNNKLRIVLGTSLVLGALASIFVMSLEIPSVLVIVLALAVLANLLMMGLHIPVRAAPPFGLTGCFSADGMPPRSFRITEMDTGLYFYQEWYMTGIRFPTSSIESMGLKNQLSSLIYFVGIFTVLCLKFTLYCLHKEEWGEFIIAFHRVIGEQIGQSICHTLDSVLILSDVTVADEALNYS